MAVAKSAKLSPLRTVRDLVRWGASEFGRAGLFFGHGTDNALDEAFHLVTWALKLPHDLPAQYLGARLTAAEREQALALLRARVATRKPAAYLTGEAWFAGLRFLVDERVLVPRSPIAELVEAGFAPWLAAPPQKVLDLCCGSGCIGIACALALRYLRVDLADIDEGALDIARHNVALHDAGERVRVVQSDLFAKLRGRRYDLIVSNPPYVPADEWQALPAEYHHEPRRALEAGTDGMDVVARILARAAEHLEAGGLLVCEIGGSTAQFERRFPGLPATWPDFERGGDGVFVIAKEDLMAWHQQGRANVG